LKGDRSRPKKRTSWNRLRAFCFMMAAIILTLMAEPSVSEESLTLPTAQIHPLPQTLAQWNETQNHQGDYFDQVKSTQPGFLIWSRWPIQVYITEPSEGMLIKPEVWRAAIVQAVKDWQPYLPLSITNIPSNADISISANPPQHRSGARVRSAETRFELYISSNPQTLAHRVSIYIRPNQTASYLSAAARHELGHGLGIWGHSLNPMDVMYFAQVRTPPAISDRDINTLKRIYQQPTRLGWPVSGDKQGKNLSLKAEPQRPLDAGHED
jgi:predicted Zn-dependent protease